MNDFYFIFQLLCENEFYATIKLILQKQRDPINTG